MNLCKSLYERVGCQTCFRLSAQPYVYKIPLNYEYTVKKAVKYEE